MNLFLGSLPHFARTVSMQGPASSCLHSLVQRHRTAPFQIRTIRLQTSNRLPPYSTFNDDQSRQVLPVTSCPGLASLTDRYRAPLGYQQSYLRLFASTHHSRRPPLSLLRTPAPTPSLKDSLLSPGENLSSIESSLVASHLHQFSCLHHLGSP